MDRYFNNHNHSEYSNELLGFPDVICSVQNLIQYAYDNGLSGLTITEHEGVSSHIQALKYYEKMDKQRPFVLGLGNEIYLMEEHENQTNQEQHNTYPYYHFILTALDTEGHHQLRILSTRAWIRGWKQGKVYRRPTFYTDLEEIIKPNQGHIICSTACLGSRLDKLLLENDIEAADKEIDRLVDIFGKGNIYIECQPPKAKDTDQSNVNNLLWKTAKYHNIPIIPTTDTHYLKAEDSVIHKTFLLSQDGDREVDEFYATAYMMSAEELREYLRVDFTDEQIDQMYQNSQAICERIIGYNIRHDPIIPQVPQDKIPDAWKITHRYKEYYGRYPAFEYYANIDDNEHEEYFFCQIEQALKSKVEDKGKNIEEYIARLNEEWTELKIISEQLHTSMASYYQTMSYIIDLIWDADSLAMPARGSAAGFLTCYLLEVTQIDPVPLGSYMPSWRHLNHLRGVELPDIDNDSEASKKKQIVNKMKEFFGEDKVLNVATFARLSSKTAIERACKGLGISEDVAGYLKSLIPVNRGKVAKIKDALYGENKVNGLLTEMQKYPHLIESCLAMEGLMINRGTHAAGVIVCNTPYTDYIAAMRSADGTLETCYDLWDAEEAGCIKFDMLTTVCADKIHKTMDLLLENGKITWEGSLKKTYYKWLHPDVLDYDNKDMWAILPSVYSVFQFDTPISQQALKATHPQSVMDLSAANSLLRLMPDTDETPINKYKRYKEKYQAWVDDTTAFGLDDNERAILWEYLADAYGLADSQEKIMRLSMDERVSGYSLKEANSLRKSIAKKDEKLQAEAKALFYEYGERQGTRPVFIDYIWNVVFAASMGYSFSQLHSYSYSIIALQELNLNYFYPKVYWNCACLSIEAAGINDNGDTSGATDYGEVAKAIYKMKQSDIIVSAPNINISNTTFTPVEDDNTILYGIAGIASINSSIAQQIISNRPYTSFTDFYNKNTYQGSLVTPSKMIMLIKAGCFDCFCKDRIKVMKKYLTLAIDKPKALTMSNIPAIKSTMKLPKQIFAPYNFYKYITSKQFFYSNHPQFKSKKLYWLDDYAQTYFDNNCINALQENVDYWYESDRTIVVDKSIEKLFKSSMDAIKTYINTDEFLSDYYVSILKKKLYEIDPTPNANRWSMQALSYYSDEHELAHVDCERYNITCYSDLPEEPNFVERSWGKRTWRQYELTQIAGTIIDKVDKDCFFTILTHDNQVVNVKMNQGAYAHYKAQLSEIIDGQKQVIEKPWISRGTLVIIAGYRRGENAFVAKKYKSSIYRHQMQKIVGVNDDGSIEIQSTRYGSEEDE